MKEKREFARQLMETAQLPLKKAAKVLDLERSSLYYKPMPKQEKKSTMPLDPVLVEKLRNLDGYALTLGYRKTAVYLSLKESRVFNHKKVYRHMDELELLQPKIVKRPQKKKPPAVLWYCPLQSNARWEADLTLVSCHGSHLYLFTVIDVFDKEVVGSWFGFRCRKEDAIEALKQAILARFPEGKVPQNLMLTLRLDRGCQFTAFDFAKAAKLFQIDLEFCDVQAPNQKPFIESFFANFKREEVYRNDYQNPVQAFLAWKNYLRWYNTERPHAAINYLSPAQFRQLIAQKSSRVQPVFVSKNTGA